MNGLALTSLYRSLTRHPLYAALNIGGLAVGIAVFFVLALYVRFETSFERWLPHHDQVYLVQTEWKRADGPFTGTYPYTMGGLLDALRQDLPGIVGTRFMGGADMDGKDGGSVVRNGVATFDDIGQVDASFLQVFDLPWVAGDKASALADPTSVILSQSAARKYFGDADPIGQTMTLSLDKVAPYRVTGVFEDLPRTSDFKFSILARLPTTDLGDWWDHWGSTSLKTYLRFPDEDAARAFERKMPGFVARRGARDLGKDAATRMALPLLPLVKAHLQPAGQASATRKMTIATLGLVGVLTLFIAIVNYVNLASARAGLRAREVAMRKVLGASRGMLIRQFMGEAVLAAALAALLGLMLAETGLPMINAAGGLSLTMPYAVIVPVLLVLAIGIGVLAGCYPAMLLSRFPAAAVLASARTPGGGRAGARVREALVMAQFAVVIAFLIGTAVLVAQTRHVRNADLGFRREGLLVAPWLGYVDQAKQPALIAAFRTVPGVSMVTTSDTGVGNVGNNNGDNLLLPGRPAPGPAVRHIHVGSDFFRLFGVRPIAGRLLDDAHRMDDRQNREKGVPGNIVISRTAAAALGFRTPAEAIGRTVVEPRPMTIVGVVEDLRFFSPRLPETPVYYTYAHGIVPYPVATMRFTGDPRAVKEAVRAAWIRIAPEAPFRADTGDRLLQNFYDDDDRATRLFGIGAGLAVLIGCVGLWGLASFNTQRRVKEIGIRKTLGASSVDIMRLLVGQFLRPVLLANLIAWPLAFVAMRTWLAGFDDRIALSPLHFLCATALALGIAVLTVAGQAVRASRMEPAWALRHD